MGKKASWVAGMAAILIAIFFSQSDKGLFELGQSLCTYLAPPVSTVFIIGLLWKRATPKAAELTLYLGTAICLIIGFCQLIGFPDGDTWPHFMLLCFYMMAGLVIFMLAASLLTSEKTNELSQVEAANPIIVSDKEVFSRQLIFLWLMVVVVMAIIYVVFN